MANAMKHMIKNSDAGLLIVSMMVVTVNLANRTPILMSNIMPTTISKRTRRTVTTVIMMSPYSMGPC